MPTEAYRRVQDRIPHFGAYKTPSTIRLSSSRISTRYTWYSPFPVQSAYTVQPTQMGDLQFHPAPVLIKQPYTLAGIVQPCPLIRQIPAFQELVRLV